MTVRRSTTGAIGVAAVRAGSVSRDKSALGQIRRQLAASRQCQSRSSACSVAAWRLTSLRKPINPTIRRIPAAKTSSRLIALRAIPARTSRSRRSRERRGEARNSLAPGMLSPQDPAAVVRLPSYRYSLSTRPTFGIPRPCKSACFARLKRGRCKSDNFDGILCYVFANIRDREVFSGAKQAHSSPRGLQLAELLNDKIMWSIQVVVE